MIPARLLKHHCLSAVAFVYLCVYGISLSLARSFRYANGSPSTALQVFRYAASRHPISLLRADFVLAFAECLSVVASTSSTEGGSALAEGISKIDNKCSSNSSSPTLRDVRSLYERSLAAMSAATAAYHAHLAQTSVGKRPLRFGFEVSSMSTSHAFLTLSLVLSPTLTLISLFCLSLSLSFFGGCQGDHATLVDEAKASGVGLDWRGAVAPPGPKPIWLAYMRFEVRAQGFFFRLSSVLYLLLDFPAAKLQYRKMLF